MNPPPSPAENPFSARRVRPGAAAYLFAPGTGAAELVERLRGNGWQGQIVGPHGSGKSALLAALLAALGQAGRATRLIELHDGQRALPGEWLAQCERAEEAVLAVDGYEQLGALARFRLRRLCRRRRLGLVVTSHVPVGLPDLAATATTPELAQQIVDRLQEGYPALVTSEDVGPALADHGGDLREMLFALYDLYEERLRGAPPGAQS